MVERESKVKTKANTKKKLLIAAGVVVVALAAALIFISNYLVNYAIGRSGNGGDREVALEVDAPADSVEAVMEDNRAAYKSKIDTFTKGHPGQDVTLTADDGLTLHGVYYAMQRPLTRTVGPLYCTDTAVTTQARCSWQRPIMKLAIK